MTKSLRRYSWELFLFAVALGLFTTPSYAQFNSSIEGAVTDSSGTSVANATVELTRVETGVKQSATTNDSGNFTFPTLPAGEYTVPVTAVGFDKAVINHVVLQPSQVRS